MRPSYESCLELFRQLRVATQLQHAWIVQLWQEERGLHPAAALLLSDLSRLGECRPSELAKHRGPRLIHLNRTCNPENLREHVVPVLVDTANQISAELGNHEVPTL